MSPYRSPAERTDVPLPVLKEEYEEARCAIHGEEFPGLAFAIVLVGLALTVLSSIMIRHLEALPSIVFCLVIEVWLLVKHARYRRVIQAWRDQERRRISSNAQA